MPQISVGEVFEEQKEKLGLSWIAGDDRMRLLESETINESNQSLVGHLNFIHPNWIQVLSYAETSYLDSFDESEQRKKLEQIFSGNIVCVIVTEQAPVSAILVEMANASGTPLIHSTQKSIHMMWLLRHYLAKKLAESTVLHGVFLDVLGMGVLITGDSGVGKSELALELINRGSGLISDDVVEFYRIAPETLEGRSPNVLKDFLEVRGIGLLNIKTIFGENAVRPKKNLKLIVNLKRSTEADLGQMERIPLASRKQEVLGVEVSQVTLPVAVGRNLAVLVEVAVRNYILLTRGIDCTMEFIERHRDQMEGLN